MCSNDKSYLNAMQRMELMLLNYATMAKKPPCETVLTPVLSHIVGLAFSTICLACATIATNKFIKVRGTMGQPFL